MWYAYNSAQFFQHLSVDKQRIAYVPMIQLFMRYGAELNLLDADGNSLLDWVIMNGNGEHMVTFLYLLGARTFTQSLRVKVSSKAEMSRQRRLVNIMFAMMPPVCMALWLFSLSKVPWYIAAALTVFLSLGLHLLVVRFLLPKSGMSPGFNNSPYLSSLVLASYFYVLLIWMKDIVHYPDHDMFGLWLFMQAICFTSTLAGLFFYVKTMLSDPGFIPLINDDVQNESKYVICLAKEGILDKDHFCTTCFVRRPLRSKHCSFVNRCTSRYDHYCPWIYNCIGGFNHRYFIMFLVFLCSAGASYIFNISWYLQILARTSTTIHVANDTCYLSELWCKYFDMDSSAAFFVFWTGFQVFWAFIILVTQLSYVASGITTNEHMNFWKYHWLNNSDQQNPFDLGVMSNCFSFWFPEAGAWRHVDWRTLYIVPKPAEYNMRAMNPMRKKKVGSREYINL